MTGQQPQRLRREGVVYSQPHPVEFASVDDLVAFLKWLDSAIDTAIQKRRESVRELMEAGYGDVEIRLQIRAGRVGVAAINIGTTHREDQEERKAA
ncbi:MAG TPA: hypothetical protein VD948_08540 [Rhodothermales bacterium]|nr:hypothetical protein [Rhodothermales bacterium]